jgi:hypothetical protein
MYVFLPQGKHAFSMVQSDVRRGTYFTDRGTDVTTSVCPSVDYSEVWGKFRICKIKKAGWLPVPPAQILK